MKKKLNEKMGGGMRIGLGGTNSAGPYYDYYKTNNPTGYHTGGYTGNADSQISQRHALTSIIEDDQEIEDDEEETLAEFFARMIKMPLSENIKDEIEDDEDVMEMSIAGVTTPLGTNSKGELPTEEDENKRHLKNKKFFGGLK